MSEQDSVFHAVMVALPCSLLELSPLYEILSENLVHSIALIPFEIFQ